MSVRTRFAPSPTGYLHIGSVRTALYAWLYARKHKGTFILRIEDTDRERSTEESIQAIFEGMQWLNLKEDEGPYYQSKRFARYAEVAQQLLVNRHAYRCICSKERLDDLRKTQLANKAKPRYDGHCREKCIDNEQQPYVVRFRNPQEGEVVVQDQVHGVVIFQNSELDDLIILRSDGVPTYNFTVVVDDMDMGITHVIRGDDHLNNTPRQINLLHALNANIPVYAHLPMILGPDGKRLSKRHGAVNVMQYRDNGYLPEAVLNYLVRLGWSHGDQEIFSIDEMVRLFDIIDLNKSPAAFNPEKLLWLNQHYLKSMPASHLVIPLQWQLQRLGIEFNQGPNLQDLIVVQAERVKTLAEMAENSRFFFQDIPFSQEAVSACYAIKPALQSLVQRLEGLQVWTNEALHQAVHEVASEFSLSFGKLAQPLRLALTGGNVSPPIDSTLRLLGKAKTLERIARVIA